MYSGLGFDIYPSSLEKRRSYSINADPQTPTARDIAIAAGSSKATAVTMRSTKGMTGLLLAEVGASMVELDVLGGGSGFREGRHIAPGAVTPVANASRLPGSQRGPKRPSALAHTLSRHGTLLSCDATAARNAAELKSLLGNSRSRVKAGAATVPPPGTLLRGQRHPGVVPASPVVLEQGKARSRVEVDITLESLICIEGGSINGNVKINILKPTKKEGPVFLSEGKIRIAGFEVAPNDEHRHIFYQVAVPFIDVTSGTQNLYTSPPDAEGFSQAREGCHILPFSMKLPIGGTGGNAKGIFHSSSGAMIKYIAIASIKLKEPSTNRRSVAHFYRDCEVWPALDPFAVLAPSPQPLQACCAKKLFLGGSGKLRLTASLHRGTWVAGQRCCVRIAVDNGTRKAVKRATLALVRTTTVFRPQPDLDAAGPGSALAGDPDACQTATTQKQVAEATLCAGRRGTRGCVSAKGWWTGVEPGERTAFTHFLALPADALSVSRSRLLEVTYSVRVSHSAGSLAADVHVSLPVRIVNFLSIDPPPSAPVDSPDKSASLFGAITLNSDSGSDTGTPRPPRPRSDQRERDSRHLGDWASRPRSSTSATRPCEGLPLTMKALSEVFPSADPAYDCSSPEDIDELLGALGEISDPAVAPDAIDGEFDGECASDWTEVNTDGSPQDWRVDNINGGGSRGGLGLAGDADSDEELEFVVGSARLEAAEWREDDNLPRELEEISMPWRDPARDDGSPSSQSHRNALSRQSRTTGTSQRSRRGPPAEHSLAAVPPPAAGAPSAHFSRPPITGRSRSDFRPPIRLLSPTQAGSHVRSARDTGAMAGHVSLAGTRPSAVARQSFPMRVQEKLAAAQVCGEHFTVGSSVSASETHGDAEWESRRDSWVSKRNEDGVVGCERDGIHAKASPAHPRRLPQCPTAIPTRHSYIADDSLEPAQEAPAPTVSSVRSRIAMLEQRARGGSSAVPSVRPSLGRSVTTGSIVLAGK